MLVVQVFTGPVIPEVKEELPIWYTRTFLFY